MEHWLVCFAIALPEATRCEIIRAAGAELSPDYRPVPVGGEVAVQVDADATAVARLRAHAEVRGVYPDSEMTLY
jgi:hypothetical protein